MRMLKTPRQVTCDFPDQAVKDGIRVRQGQLLAEIERHSHDRRSKYRKMHFA